jgi:hypothetical protein
MSYSAYTIKFFNKKAKVFGRKKAIIVKKQLVYKNKLVICIKKFYWRITREVGKNYGIQQLNSFILHNKLINFLFITRK